MPAMQAWETKFISRAPMRKLVVAVLIGPNLVEEADSRFSEFADYQFDQS